MGITTYGDADIGGVPIAGFVESFFEESLSEDQDVEAVAKALLEFFRGNNPIPASHFHVGGYTETKGITEQQVWHVDVQNNVSKQANPPNQQGASWGGEIDILTRLLQPLAQLDENGNITTTLPVYPIPWGFFTLQDAIDFAIFATRSTIEAIRFQPRPKRLAARLTYSLSAPMAPSGFNERSFMVNQQTANISRNLIAFFGPAD